MTSGSVTGVGVQPPIAYVTVICSQMDPFTVAMVPVPKAHVPLQPTAATTFATVSTPPYVNVTVELVAHGMPVNHAPPDPTACDPSVESVTDTVYGYDSVTPSHAVIDTYTSYAAGGASLVMRKSTEWEAVTVTVPAAVH